MTISTDTQPQRAGRRPGRPGSARLEAYGVGIALAVALGALAVAGHSTYGPGTDNGSAWTRPTPALHGQTLAAYVAAHEAARLPRQP